MFGGNHYYSSPKVQSGQECVLLCLRDSDCDLVVLTAAGSGRYCLMYREEDYVATPDQNDVTYKKNCPAMPGKGDLWYCICNNFVMR